MKRNLKILLFLLVAVFLWAGTSFGENITIYDGSSSGTGWYGANEDQEVEPGDVTGQVWDLEGFFLDGAELSMVGGYNFASGQVDPYRSQNTYLSGDIFLDVTGDFNLGSSLGTGDGYKTINNSFGYDYAIDFDFSTGEYQVFSLTENSLLSSVYFRENDKSNAFQYESGGTSLTSGTFSYLTGLLDEEVDLSGGSHNAVVIDLSSFLGDNVTFTSHFTMGCGNDNLLGKGTTSVPEPTPMILLGSSLIGLAGFGRKKFFKK